MQFPPIKKIQNNENYVKNIMKKPQPHGKPGMVSGLGV